jgi:hypothetical protein
MSGESMGAVGGAGVDSLTITIEMVEESMGDVGGVDGWWRGSRGRLPHQPARGGGVVDG